MTERFSPSIEFWIGVLQVVFASQDAAYYVEKNVFDIPYSTVGRRFESNGFLKSGLLETSSFVN